ncbi:MAG: DNA polymerase III subunit gamma/tau, partial [Campylobacterota bacterium]|nr:DNA polymerase III subunit gamma/tau [Campylobacterota bacterium]
KHRACTKEIVEKKNDSVENVTEQPIMQEPQSISMVEDAEIGGSASCVTNCSSSEDSIKEIDGVNIKDEPMVQKAVELFEATKITIQSKI